MPAPPENSNPQTSPAGHKVHWKVPMQPTFPTLSPAGQASPALVPFGQRVISETASLRTHCLLNLSFLLTPTRTQTAGSFPFLSPHCQSSSYATCTFPYPLALSWQCCRQPTARPQHSWLQSQHRLATHPFSTTVPPSIMTASSGWSSGSCYSQVCAKSHAGVSSLLCHGADMFSCPLPACAEAP